MPMYDFRCDTCGHTTAIVCPIVQRNNTFPCDREGCAGTVKRLEVSGPARVQPDYPGFISPATGKWVEGRVAHRDDLARSGCRVLEAGETESFKKERVARRESAWEKSLSNAFAQSTKQLGMS